LSSWLANQNQAQFLKGAARGNPRVRLAAEAPKKGKLSKIRGSCFPNLAEGETGPALHSREVKRDKKSRRERQPVSMIAGQKLAEMAETGIEMLNH
jgi:hypothetical protein